MSRAHEHARALLQKAAEDAWTLEHLAEEPDAPLAVLGFHAQQAVEKGLKAVISAQSMSYPRTHNLSMLAELLHDHGHIPPDPDALAALTAFGVGMRYPADIPENWPEGLDLAQCRTLVSSVLEWADAQLPSHDSDQSS